MAQFQFNIKHLKRIGLHLLLWLSVLAFFVLVFDADNTVDSDVFYFSLFLMPVTIGTTYVCIYKLIPDYLITKRYFLFSLYSVYTVIISTFGVVISVFFAIAYLTDFRFTKILGISRNAIFIMACIYLVAIIISAFKLLKLNLKQSKYNAELEAKILEAQLKLKDQELKYLKMQIHPHFLFNTLNTLYGSALKQSEDTPNMILKLSNLLDYLLYQVDKPTVDLSEEINHIEDYVSLEQMRFSDTLKVNLKKSNCSKSLYVAPMLFLPFVENSFKHGTIVNGTLMIHIQFECTENHINFSIVNSHAPSENTTSGIGLENIKKRLNLLYKNQHELVISETASEFCVNLSLQLKPKLTDA
ncbi:histidine kinase [Winogradskyella maritima]|uniref:Sensor histidine kinase n=1 Tax=Winogradskyella maritima TaxID=1517766 RepID=A0ABV8AHD4_9FLAO|nr:histidine kinase [Winogradskyella maritima]